MNNERCFGRWWLHLVRFWVAVALLAMGTLTARAETPDWLRAAAQETLPTYGDTVDGVVLLDDEQTTIAPDGQIKTLTRRVVRVLSLEGVKKWGAAAVGFDSETKLNYIKAWSITSGGKDYEVKDKDKVESSYSGDALFTDTKYAYVKVPGVEVGTVVGYEYLQNRRPAILQDIWEPQESVPVHHARYSLRLPAGWSYRMTWMKGAPHEPVASAQNSLVWDMREVAAIKREPSAPSLRLLSVRMGVTFVPPSPQGGHAFSSWTDVAQWFGEISAASVKSSPELDAKVRQLVPPSSSADEKIRILSDYVQKQVRYVAIEIGIGGYQPHAASATLLNKYGDCKDKATLLTVLLREAWVESYPMLVNSSRGMVRPDFPSPYQFDHMIVAIHVPADSKFASTPAAADEGPLGRLLFFDPTAETYPVGTLHDMLQNSEGLILAGSQTRMATLPTASPDDSTLKFVSDFNLSADGSVVGTVTATCSGSWAARMREELADKTRSEKAKWMENFLAGMRGTPNVTRSFITDESDVSKPLVLRFELQASGYAEIAGGLMLMRLRMLGSVADNQFAWKAIDTEARKLPIEYAYTGVYSEVNTVNLPSGFGVDELPDELNISGPALSYMSHAEAFEGKLKYKRECRITSLSVPLADVDKLKALYREIRVDEQKTAVLKRPKD